MVQTKKHNKILIGFIAIALAVVCVLLPFISVKRNNVYAEQQAVIGGYYSGYQNIPIIVNSTSSSMNLGYYGGYVHWSYDIMPGTNNSFVLEMLPDGVCYRYYSNNGSTTDSIYSLSLYNANVGSPGTNGQYSYTLAGYSRPVLISADTIDYYFCVAGSGTGFYMNLYHTLSTNNEFFNGQIVAMTITSSWGIQVRNWSTFWTNKYSNRSSSFLYFITTYTYTDTNGATFNIAIPTKDSYGTHTYYNVESMGDSAQYQIGFDNGVQNGRSIGYGLGYSAGKNTGYTLGYNEGYTDGQDTQYTFVNVIGAVIDAPIQAITGLLNFEIFGVNLSGLFYGLITVAIIIVIIRKIKG